MKWYKRSMSSSSLSDYATLKGYSEEDLSWLGSGDFGNAYLTPDGKVIKETGSSSEAEIAMSLIGKTGSFAEIYNVENINGYYYILQEYVEISQDIENLYYDLSHLLEQQGLPIQYVHMLDEDEIDPDYKISEELHKFISDIEDINLEYRILGIEASDIRPENLGYNKSGKVVAFDLDNRSA